MAKGKTKILETKNQRVKSKYENVESSEEEEEEDHDELEYDESEESNEESDSNDFENDSEEEMESGEDNEEESSEDDENDQESNSDQEDEDKAPKSSREDGFRDAIRSELNSMTFEQIQQLQNKLGLKKFKEVMQDKSDNANDDSPSNSKTFKRLNKNRPQELSSKKPVPVLRNVFQAKKKEFIDPRFNPALGEYKPEVFRKRFGFINEMRENERKMLQEELKKEEDPVRREQIKAALTRLKQQITSFKASEKKEEFKAKLKKTANEDAKEGKRPHFVNKSEQKILELAEKYKELKKNGKIEKFLAKKRKKQLSKDSKHLGTNSKHLKFI